MVVIADDPPVYCYANWDDLTRQRMGTETFPPADYCNISCAYHMGDPTGTFRRIRAAVREGKGICAHPGLDIAINGRPITAEDVYTYTICQLGALKAMVEGEGGRLTHVKPHGMLYILLRDQSDLMRAFVKAHVSVVGKDVAIHGLAQTNHEAVAVEMGVAFVAEILKDKVDLVRKASAPTPPTSPERRRPRLSVRRPSRPSVTLGRSRSASMGAASQSRPPAPVPVVASAPARVQPPPPPPPPPTLRRPEPPPRPHSPPSSVPSSPLSSVPTSACSSARTSISDDYIPRTIANTLQTAHENTNIPLRPGLVSCPSSSSSKGETSTQRIFRQLHYWTMTPIPTLIESRRPGTGSGSATPARTHAAGRPSADEHRSGDCETQ